MRRNETLSAPQQRVRSLLIQGATITYAANAAGAGRTTVSRWVNHDPAFQHELRRKRHEAWRLLRSRLVGHAHKALDELAAFLSSNCPEYRMAAARHILALTPLKRGEPIGPWPDEVDAETDPDPAEPDPAA